MIKLPLILPAEDGGVGTWDGGDRLHVAAASADWLLAMVGDNIHQSARWLTDEQHLALFLRL